MFTSRFFDLWDQQVPLIKGRQRRYHTIHAFDVKSDSWIVRYTSLKVMSLN